ncbi:MAG TPA: hypothetical protein PK843_11600 [bacterium]|nr:hypothetical protein [bacterium]
MSYRGPDRLVKKGFFRPRASALFVNGLVVHPAIAAGTTAFAVHEPRPCNGPTNDAEPIDLHAPFS